MRRLVSPVLVARREELALLRRAAERVAAGETAAVVVGGEAGVGKTRLLTEAAAELEGAGFEVLTGACAELGGEALPLAPLVDAMRTLQRTRPPEQLDGIMGAARPMLARLLPELDPAAPAGGELQPARLFELVVGMLGRLAAERPVALVVEDAQWADQATLDLVAFLIRALRDVRVLLVVSYRSDELHRGHPLRRLLAELERNRSVERLELPRFSRAEVAEQLEAIRGQPPEPGLADLVFERSEGNAFLVEETLEIAASGAEEMPPSLRDVLLARVDRLGDDARRVLRAAAAAGGRVAEPLLAAVAGLPEARLLAALREAVEHHLLIVEPDGAYRFRHALARDAVYEDMLPGERGRLHAAFGAALEAEPQLGGGSTAASIAWHWYAALDLPRALPACVRAAQEGIDGYAVAEALRQCERALEIWDRVPDAEERTGLDRLGLLELTLRASIRAGHEPRALEHAAAALAEVDAAAAEPKRRALILADRAEALQRLGRDNVADLEAAVELLGDEPSRELAAVLALLGRAHTLRGTEAEGQSAAQRALEVARAVGATSEEASALLVLGSVRTYLGEVEGGIESLRESLALAIAEGADETTVAAYANLSDALELAGLHAEAADVAGAGVELSHRLGLVRRTGIFIAGNRAESLGRMGRIDEALRVAGEAVALGADSASAASPQIIRAELLVQRGRYDEARVHAAAVRAVLGEEPPHQYQAHICLVEAELARVAGDADGARAALERGLSGERAMLARYRWPLVSLGLRIEADAAEAARARREEPQGASIERVERLWAAAEEYEVASPAARGHRALAVAERERALGRDEAAAWERAVAAWREPGDPYPLAYALLRLAEAHAEGGDVARARGPLGEALSLARTLGAEPLAAEVEALARRARVDVSEQAGDGAAVEEDPFGLTDREREVLRLIAAGSSNAQIGAALFISPKTASVHVSNILGKLGVERRGEAAAVAHRLGLS